jgi:ADP-heptose:LPS heptosyltransferase
MTVDRSDLFDRLLRVESKKNYVLPVDEAHKEDLLKRFGSVRKPHIGIVATSKSSVRVIPQDYIEPLAKGLLKAFGGTVFLLGKAEPWGQAIGSLKGRHIVNLVDHLFLPEAVAMTSLLDFMISPDTAPVHFAAALKVKTIGLFGNIHPRTRTTYYPMVTPIYPEGEMPCIPCWDKPKCNHRGKIGADCMRIMTPDRIVAEAKRVWT